MISLRRLRKSSNIGALKILRIGRSLGYQLAHEYLILGGTSGLPVIRFSKECYRVPRWALIELVTNRRTIVLGPRAHELRPDR